MFLSKQNKKKVEKKIVDFDQIDFQKVIDLINSPNFYVVGFFKLRDYILGLGFSGEENKHNWPYSFSKLLVQQGYISEAQKLHIRMFNNKENLLDAHSSLEKYFLNNPEIINLGENGLNVLDFITQTTEKMDYFQFFRNLSKNKKYQFSYCQESNLDNYLALGSLTEDPKNENLLKYTLSPDNELIQKKKTSALFKDKRGVVTTVYFNGEDLDSIRYKNGRKILSLSEQDNNRLKLIKTLKLVRIYTDLGDLYDIRVERYRKILPESGEDYFNSKTRFEKNK